MQVIYGDASNINLTAQKRLIRVVEGQTQATPYAGYLDPSLRNTDGSIRIPKETDTTPVAREKEAFTYQNSLTPGLVMVKTTGENYTVAASPAEAVRPAGLLAQWVGGVFDGVKQTNEIAVWQGVDSVYDLLAPAWNDEGLAAAVSAAAAGKAPLLYAGKDGRLTYISSPGSRVAVAEVIDRPSSSVLRIKLLV
jgi:hypothetical protein